MIFKNIDLDGNNVLKNKVPLLIKEKGLDKIIW